MLLRMSRGVAGEAQKSEVAHRFCASFCLFNDMVDLCHLGDDTTTHLADTPVPSNHKFPSLQPGGRTVTSSVSVWAILIRAFHSTLNRLPGFDPIRHGTAS
jgi:hypothetical protein